MYRYQLKNLEGFDTSQPHFSGPAAAYLRYFGRAMTLSVGQVKNGDGVFLASCLTHTGNFAYPASLKNTIAGTTFVGPIGDWFFGRNKVNHRLQDICGELPCGAGCPV